MNHTVEIDQKTFADARKLMAVTQLEAVRLTRCKVDIDVSEQPSDEAKVSLKLEAKSDGRKTSDTELTLHFDFKLLGSRGDEGEKPLEIMLRLVALYTIPRGFSPTRTQIRAFASSNGMLNAWPYFREFVQSISARGGLPPLTVPLFRINYVSLQKS